MGNVDARIEILRPFNLVMGAFAIFVSTFIASGGSDFSQCLADNWISILIMTLSAMAFIGGGDALNDYLDAEIDSVTYPGRPIPSGRISVRLARNLGVGLLLGSLVLAILTFNVWCVVLMAIAVPLAFLYEIVFKVRGFFGNVIMGLLGGIVLLLGGAIIGDPMANFNIALASSLVMTAREIAMDIEDMEGDVGRETLPMSVGTRAASFISALFFIEGVIAAMIPIFKGMYGPLYSVAIVISALFFIYAVVMLFRDLNKCQKAAKLGMLLALVAFLLGAFRF